MFNHARTLLLNLPGAAGLHSELGEELIPADYVPLTLPGSLQHVRRLLFGAQPDRLMLNYRSRQLLTLLHATPLAEFVTALDPRTTYDLRDDPFFNEELFWPSVTTLAGTRQLTYVGGSLPPDYSGVMRQGWLVTITGASTASLRSLSSGQVSTQAFTIGSNGISNQLTLPGVASRVQFQEPAVNDSWLVRICSRPQVSLGSLLASLQMIGGDVLADLFATATPAGQTEPFTTFRNLWRDHHELAFALGGLVLALIYRTEQLRSE